MANIIVLLREESSLSLLENGTASVGGLQVGELGYNEASQEFSYKNRVSSAFRHITTREKMLLGAAAATSGAKGVGYFPASGLTSVTVQDALDELRAQVAAGGGGTVLGSGTVGTIPKFSTTTTLANSILSEASSKIIFSADSVANLYRDQSAVLKTDGSLRIAQNLEVTGPITAGAQAFIYLDGTQGLGYVADNTVIDNAAAWGMTGTVTKNNSNTRTIYGLRLRHVLNAGGSNLNTTFNLLELDTINTALTGLTVNLCKMSYGGTQKLLINSAGDIAARDFTGRDLRSSSLSNNYIPLCNGGLIKDSSISHNGVSGCTGIGKTYTDAILFIGAPVSLPGDIELDDSGANPTPTASAASLKFYYKGGKFVMVVNDGGTVRYKYLDILGTGVTWVHTTSAP